MIKLLASTYLASTLAQSSFGTTFDDSFGGTLDFIGGSMEDSFSMGGTDMDSFGGSMDGSFGGSMDGSFGGSMDDSFGGSMDDSFGGSMGTLDDSFMGSVDGGFMGSVDDGFMGSVDDGFMGSVDDGFMGSVDDGFMGSVDDELPVCECHTSYDWTSFGEVCDTHCMNVGDVAYCHPGNGESMEPCGRLECWPEYQVRCRKPFCGDGICQDGEVESFCIVDCTDELADNLCTCVGELDLCDETCSALTSSQSGASSECQLMYSLAFCGQLIDDQTSYRDFCGASTCPSTLILDTVLPTSAEPTNMPTPPPTFSCSFEEKSYQCWSVAQITKQDCSEIKQWWKQIGRFLDVHGIRNYGIDSYGVDIGGDFNKLEDVKSSFLDHCSSL